MLFGSETALQQIPKNVKMTLKPDPWESYQKVWKVKTALLKDRCMKMYDSINLEQLFPTVTWKCKNCNGIYSQSKYWRHWKLREDI